MMRLGDKELVKVPSISTGSLGLDVAQVSAACLKDEWLKFMVQSLR